VEDRIAKWNDRYARGEGLHDFAPAKPVVAIPGLARAGRALDIACGAGRNALFLAENGWQVDAVDASEVGLGLMMAAATDRGVASRITPIRADLEAADREFTIEPDGYDLICDVFFLERALFPEIRRGVRPGGLLVAAIHITDPSGTPHAFLLEPGELRRMIDGWGWEILEWSEGPTGEPGHSHPTSVVIARRPAD
jgi:SAM-dependent methyltransferase